MGLFSKRKLFQLPEVLTQQEDSVNYNSVLDYLVGLSKQDYDKMIKVTGIYRDANKTAAKVMGVKDEPIVSLTGDKPSDEQIDEALDAALKKETAFIETGDIEKEPPKKPQAPDKKIELKKK